MTTLFVLVLPSILMDSTWMRSPSVIWKLALVSILGGTLASLVVLGSVLLLSVTLSGVLTRMSKQLLDLLGLGYGLGWLVTIIAFAFGLAASALLWTVGTRGAQAAGGGASINTGHITGVVTGARGPEAGVWVIAETSDLPTLVGGSEALLDQMSGLPTAGCLAVVRGRRDCS